MTSWNIPDSQDDGESGGWGWLLALLAGGTGFAVGTVATKDKWFYEGQNYQHPISLEAGRRSRDQQVAELMGQARNLENRLENEQQVSGKAYKRIVQLEAILAERGIEVPEISDA